MSCVICFNLDRPKILSSGNGFISLLYCETVPPRTVEHYTTRERKREQGRERETDSERGKEKIRKENRERQQRERGKEKTREDN